MEFIIPVNQQLMIDWGVTLQQYSLIYIIALAEDGTWAEKKIIDNKEFVFITKPKFHKELPIIKNEKHIRATLLRIIDKGLIEKADDLRTFWRLTDIGSKIKEKYTKNQTNEGAESEVPEDELFDRFWYLFPKHASKKEAQEEFSILTQEQKDHAIYSAKLYAEAMQETEKKFIMLAKNWIAKAKYEDYNFIVEDEKLKEQTQDKIKVLAEKLRQVVGKYRKNKEDEQIRVPIEQIQLKKGGDLFTKEEKSMLLEMGYTVENYDDIEFQDGEIEINLRGYFND